MIKGEHDDDGDWWGWRMVRFVKMFCNSWTCLLQNLGFESGPDQLLLADTIESDPPEAPIWAIGDPSSLMIFIYIIEVGDRWPADPPCRHQKWRNYVDCCHKSILSEIPTSTYGSMMMMMFRYLKIMLKRACQAASGGLGFCRIPCNGLTNRHWASGHIMTMKW